MSDTEKVLQDLIDKFEKKAKDPSRSISARDDYFRCAGLIRDELHKLRTDSRCGTSVSINGRDDEAGFRANVPKTVNHQRIIVVGEFIPGTYPGVYASAYVITIGPDDTFSTHRLVCKDDNRSGIITWILMYRRSHNSSLDQAREDLVTRHARCVLIKRMHRA